MSRLVAFGCSFTYGDELPDCVSGLDTPSKQAWPQVAADILGLECVNRGKSGIGNKHILHEIMTFDFQKSDTVVIMWSFFSRHCVICDDSSVVDISHWNTDKDNTEDVTESELWIKNASYAYYVNPGLQTELDDLFNNLIYIQQAHSYLESMNIKQVHASIPGIIDRGLSTFQSVCDRNLWYKHLLRNDKSSHISDYIKMCQKWNKIKPALVFVEAPYFGHMPQGHPNADSHQFFAGRLAEYILENTRA